MGVVDLVSRPAYSQPTPIKSEHRLDGFDCGREALNDWLRAHALENEGKASRTFVVADAAMQVRAYYTLATGNVVRAEVPRRYRHGLPNPVPVMVLGRLAVDKDHARRGLAKGMLREAVRRTLRVAEDAGVRALVVHAIDDEAVGFYAKYQFQVFPPESRTLFLPTETMRAALT